MRRKCIDLTKVSLEINIFSLENGLARVEYYSLNGDFTKQLCKSEESFKIVEQIKKERNEFWCVKDGETIYPFRREK